METGPLVGRVCVLAAGRPASNSEVAEVVEDDWITAGLSLSNDEACLDHHRRRDDVGLCCGTPFLFVSPIGAGPLMTRRVRTPSPSPVTAPVLLAVAPPPSAALARFTRRPIAVRFARRSISPIASSRGGRAPSRPKTRFCASESCVGPRGC